MGIAEVILSIWVDI